MDHGSNFSGADHRFSVDEVQVDARKFRLSMIQTQELADSADTQQGLTFNFVSTPLLDLYQQVHTQNG